LRGGRIVCRVDEGRGEQGAGVVEGAVVVEEPAPQVGLLDESVKMEREQAFIRVWAEFAQPGRGADLALEGADPARRVLGHEVAHGAGPG